MAEERESELDKAFRFGCLKWVIAPVVAAVVWAGYQATAVKGPPVKLHVVAELSPGMESEEIHMEVYRKVGWARKMATGESRVAHTLRLDRANPRGEMVFQLPGSSTYAYVIKSTARGTIRGRLMHGSGASGGGEDPSIVVEGERTVYYAISPSQAAPQPQAQGGPSFHYRALVQETKAPPADLSALRKSVTLSLESVIAPPLREEKVTLTFTRNGVGPAPTTLTLRPGEPLQVDVDFPTEGAFQYTVAGQAVIDHGGKQFRFEAQGQGTINVSDGKAFVYDRLINPNAIQYRGALVEKR
jgi:hypothetical protein